MKRSQKVYLLFKNIIGFFGSVVGIILCFSFLWWWIFIINLFVSKGHPIYVQKRIGKHEKVFGLLKFRSMRIDAPEIAPHDMTEELRNSLETKFGKFLRRTSLDETLQLLNILVGQMAFIGPRPGAAHNEEDLIVLRKQYTPNAFDVRPGLGGLAQLKMNRTHTPADKARYDHEYVSNVSLWLDIKIFAGTLAKLFGKGKGK